MTRLFEASYSPESRPGIADDEMARLPDLLQRVYRQVTAAPAASRSTRALLVLLLLGSASRLAAQDESFATDRRQFEWEEAQSLAATAANPAAFLEAARHFNTLAAEGVRSGDLFFNMGTCLLLAGEPQNAWRAFVRAERYLGRPRDLAHNMERAHAALNGGEPAPLPWDRMFLFLHYGIPLEVRLRIAALCFFLFWTAWALAWGRVRSSGQLILALTLAGALLFGSSAAVTLFQEAQETPLSLTQEGAPHAPT